MFNREINPGDHVFVVDASGFIYRAWHAWPRLVQLGGDQEIGALAGFATMIIGTLRTWAAEEQPTHVALIFDYSSRTWRNEIYPAYKAHRAPLEEGLRSQFKPIRDFVRALGLPVIEQQGFEADDLIATYATIANERGASCTIVSGDKDLMQLVTPYVGMIDPMKKARLSENDVFARWGVHPSQIVDVMALMGDASDNVPGVAGIGAKGAAELIRAAGNLETLLAAPEGFTTKPKMLERLRASVEDARLSYRLVSLDSAVELATPIEDSGFDRVDYDAGLQFLRDWGCGNAADDIERQEIAA